jgi:hypothetical protein
VEVHRLRQIGIVEHDLWVLATHLELAETSSTVEDVTRRAPRSLTEWLTDHLDVFRAAPGVTHQRIEALRKSDGVTPVAFLNAVLKC